MRSVRVPLGAVGLAGTEPTLQQGHLLVVVRDGATNPGPSDWEVLVVTDGYWRVAPGEHELWLRTATGQEATGRALVRFSDGHRHLLRGDGDLAGVDAILEGG